MAVGKVAFEVYIVTRLTGGFRLQLSVDLFWSEDFSSGAGSNRRPWGYEYFNIRYSVDSIEP